MGRPRLYTDEERKERAKACRAEWRAKNKERIAGYYLANKDSYKRKAAEWKRLNPERSKEMQQARAIARADEIKAQRRAYREKNQERVSAAQAIWREENKEKKRAYTKQWRAENPERALAADKHKNTVRQRLIGGQAMAAFYAEEIRAIYRNCPPGHHVDHIVPLKGKTVCGLHIPINLQYLPAKENMSKGARFDQEHETASLQTIYQTK